MMRFFAAVALIAVADALTLAPTNICRTSLTARRTEAIVAQFGRKPPPPPPPPPKKGLFSFGGSKTTEDVKASKPAKTVAKKATLSPAPPKPVAKKEAAAPAPPKLAFQNPFAKAAPPPPAPPPPTVMVKDS